MGCYAEFREIKSRKDALREIDRVRIWAMKQQFSNIAEALERALAALDIEDGRR